MRPNAMVVLKSVVRWWCNFKEKPHSIRVECGFIVTPTGIVIKVEREKSMTKWEELKQLTSE